MERAILNKLIDHSSKKPFTILIGARQVGKTTILKQLYNRLLENETNVFYLSFEDPDILNQIHLHPDNIFRYAIRPSENQKVYIFIDEVQYASNPSNFLKYLFDSYAPNLKIIATGSSAFYIDQKFQDSLAGRKTIFELYPLSFEEFIIFKNENRLLKDLQLIRNNPEYISTNINLFKLLLEEYIRFGSYPGVVLEKDEKNKIDLLKELKSSFLKKDILESDIENEEKFYLLLTLLANQSGQLLNVHELCNTLKINEKTLTRYIFVLQKCFHIQLIKPYYNNVRKELTKMPKIYFNDLGLRNSLLNQFNLLENRTDKGELLENLVYTFLRDTYDKETIKYWRTADNNEVDFIVETSYNEGFALEVKWDESNYRQSKYKKFIGSYPSFNLKPICMNFLKTENFVLKYSH